MPAEHLHQPAAPVMGPIMGADLSRDGNERSAAVP